MVLLAMAPAKATTGTAIKDNIRKITQGGGKTVDNAVDGLKAIAAGEKVDYAGASRPVRLRRQGRHPRLQVPLRADQGRQGDPGEGRLSDLMRRGTAALQCAHAPGDGPRSGAVRTP